jgi:hypothetical protein
MKREIEILKSFLSEKRLKEIVTEYKNALNSRYEEDEEIFVEVLY